MSRADARVGQIWKWMSHCDDGDWFIVMLIEKRPESAGFAALIVSDSRMLIKTHQITMWVLVDDDDGAWSLVSDVS